MPSNIGKVQEGGRKPPPYPSVFVKPSTCVAGYFEDIPIPKIAQDGTLDYEGELASDHVSCVADIGSNQKSRHLLLAQPARMFPKRMR
jgi:hypothetical protein